MLMKFKKIYIEITNDCNLNCYFCIHNKRNVKYMSMDEFKIILDKIKGYTKYIYLHVMGEPLMHPYINEFIDYASKDFFVNITTNGYMLEKIINNKNIRQINISLHSGVNIDNVLKCVNVLKENTIINYRVWVNNNTVIDKLKDIYKVDIKDGIKLENNIYVSIKEEFVWPDLNNNIYKDTGKCYGLNTHLGILVDGSVVPCCLDSKGDINLGNIFESSLDSIMTTDKYQSVENGFKNNKRVEELCKHCGFNIGR